MGKKHHRSSSHPIHRSEHVVNMPELLRQGREQDNSPTHAPTSNPAVQIEQIRAISKKRVACYIATTAITSSVLTAAVAMSIHFSSCK